MRKENQKNVFALGAFNDSKHPKIEDLFPNRTYSITINPKISELKVINSYQSLEEVLPFFRGNVKVKTEISTKSQNIHYHGFIRWNSYLDISLFYLNIQEIEKKVQFEIDIITDYWIWKLYIIKQRPWMSSLCKYYKVPYTITWRSQQDSEVRSSSTAKKKKELRVSFSDLE